jgi:CheY-like chemotaxis protein
VKFTKQGSITFDASINYSVESEEYSFLLIVRDTGIGINKENLISIQNNEDQINLNVNKDYNEMGSGLDINIAKNILNKLKHVLKINSDLGKGTVVSIEIKNVKANKDNIKLLPKYDTDSFNDKTIINNDIIFENNIKDIIDNLHIYKSPNHKIYNKYPRMIIADDSQVLRRSVENIAELYFSNNPINRFDIINCNDGIDILTNIKEDNELGNSNIKIIITDENMMFMSCSDSISIIKSLERNNKIKKIFIVSLTAFSDENTISYIKNKGADLVLEKPLSNETFRQIICLYNESKLIK